jgi:hypothetical protein
MDLMTRERGEFIMLFNPPTFAKSNPNFAIDPSPSMGDTCESDDVFSRLDRCYFVHFWVIYFERKIPLAD